MVDAQIGAVPQSSIARMIEPAGAEGRHPHGRVSALRLETVELEPPTAADAVVVWMHGLGARQPRLRIAGSGAAARGEPGRALRVLHAPVRAVTHQRRAAHARLVRRRGVRPARGPGRAGIRESAEAIRRGSSSASATRDRREPHPDRGLLPGRGDGASSRRCAGRSGWGRSWRSRPTSRSARRCRRSCIPRTPGCRCSWRTASSIRSCRRRRREASRETLTSVGCPVEWHSYPMLHSVCLEEVADLRRFLLRCSECRRRP